MNPQTTEKPAKNYRVTLILTLFPLTDFVGANWFYVGNAGNGLVKAILSAIVISTILYFCIARPGFEAIGIFFYYLVVTAVIIIWWLADIYLIVFKKHL